MTISLYLHALRALGPDREYHRGRLARGADVLRLFSDATFARDVLGAALLSPTPNGVRSLSAELKEARESHRDYCLAVLSEQGLSADFPLQSERGSFCLRDLLTDSLANYHLGQEELEWSALSYAMWLPPQRRWTNKFGEEFTFDSLVQELLRRPIAKGVCAGCHLVQALIVLDRVHRERHPILSDTSAQRLESRLQEIVAQVEWQQSADGSWGPDWAAAVSVSPEAGSSWQGWTAGSADVGKRILATAHIAECLLLLPDDSAAPESMVRRASEWLRARLKDADSEFITQHYCGCSHAALVLRLVSVPEGVQPADSRGASLLGSVQ